MHLRVNFKSLKAGKVKNFDFWFHNQFSHGSIQKMVRLKVLIRFGLTKRIQVKFQFKMVRLKVSGQTKICFI